MEIEKKYLVLATPKNEREPYYVKSVELSYRYAKVLCNMLNREHGDYTTYTIEEIPTKTLNLKTESMENKKIETLPLIQVSFAVNEISGLVNGMEQIRDCDKEKIHEAIKKVHDALHTANKHREHFAYELHRLANEIGKNN